MTDLPKFTLMETVVGLRAIAAGKPKKVYRPTAGNEGSCANMHGKRPGCIVGHFAYAGGVSGEYLQSKNFLSVYGLDIWAAEPAKEFARRVQVNQDCGSNWRAAFNDVLLSSFSSEYPELKDVDPIV